MLQAQIVAILYLLLAFGVPQGTVNTVQTILQNANQATSTQPGIGGFTPIDTFVPAPVPDHSSISVTDRIQPASSDGSSEYMLFQITVKDKDGNDIIQPNVNIRSSVDGISLDSYNSIDNNYPWFGKHHVVGFNDGEYLDHWFQVYSPLLNKSGVYTFVFTSNGLSTTTTITL